MVSFGVRASARRQFERVARVARRIGYRLHRSTLPPELAKVAKRVRTEGLTFVSPARLDKLAQYLLTIERQGIPGVVIETGCALGGSAILLASAKSRARPLRVYDVFGMIPPPTEKDGQDVHERYQRITAGKARGLKGQRYYGYETDLYERVRRNFERHGFGALSDHDIELIQGLLENTLVVDRPVSLAHIDVDWYEPVMTSLERVAPRLSPGGVIVLDDYFDWSGCRKATDDFLARTTFTFERDRSAHSLALIKR
jgi:predicted O-methyltransferase YrrM